MFSDPSFVALRATTEGEEGCRFLSAEFGNRQSALGIREGGHGDGAADSGEQAERAEGRREDTGGEGDLTDERAETRHLRGGADG